MDRAIEQHPGTARSIGGALQDLMREYNMDLLSALATICEDDDEDSDLGYTRNVIYGIQAAMSTAALDPALTIVWAVGLDMAIEDSISYDSHNKRIGVKLIFPREKIIQEYKPPLHRANADYGFAAVKQQFGMILRALPATAFLDQGDDDLSQTVQKRFRGGMDKLKKVLMFLRHMQFDHMTAHNGIMIDQKEGTTSTWAADEDIVEVQAHNRETCDRLRVMAAPHGM